MNYKSHCIVRQIPTTVSLRKNPGHRAIFHFLGIASYFVRPCSTYAIKEREADATVDLMAKARSYLSSFPHFVNI